MSIFPGAISSFLGFTSGHTLSADQHASQHNSEQAEIIAAQTKIGTGSSTPTSGMLLRGNGAGTSAWAQVNLISDITGVLPTANGGSGNASLIFPSGTETVVGRVTTDTMTNKTLTAPTISDFTNANHSHTNTAGGGVLGTSALSNASITPDKLSSATKVATVAAGESRSSVTYGDLGTVGPSVTVTIGANGIALVFITCRGTSDTSGDHVKVSYSATGANTITAGDTKALILRNSSGAQDSLVTMMFPETGLTAGATTFTLKYSNDAGAGTATFTARTLTVVPL